MLLALLMLVPGRLGGALGGAPALWFDAVRAMPGAGGAWRLSIEAAGFRSGIEPAAGMDLGGSPPETDRPGGGGVPEVGGGVPVIDLGPALGGGGVAVLAGVFSAPGFLLTQRLSSGS